MEFHHVISRAEVDRFGLGAAAAAGGGSGSGEFELLFSTSHAKLIAEIDGAG